MSTQTQTPTEPHAWSKREILQDLTDITKEVVASYVDARSFHPLAASQIDHDAQTSSRRLTPLITEWLADIERATEKALGGDTELERGWFRIAFGEDVEPHIASQIYQKCGRLYKSRKLRGGQYLRRDRYPRRAKIA